MAFQFAARYGSNTHVDPKLLSVYSKPRWTNDPVNEVKIGLNTVKYMECDNERDKWWERRKKRIKMQMNMPRICRLIMMVTKADWGRGVGVKNCRPEYDQVVMAGLSKPDPAYVQER